MAKKVPSTGILFHPGGKVHFGCPPLTTDTPDDSVQTHNSSCISWDWDGRYWDKQRSWGSWVDPEVESAKQRQLALDQDQGDKLINKRLMNFPPQRECHGIADKTIYLSVIAGEMIMNDGNL